MIIDFCRLKTQELLPSVTVQENFGMAEGVLMFVRRDDPLDVRLQVGAPEPGLDLEVFPPPLADHQELLARAAPHEVDAGRV